MIETTTFVVLPVVLAALIMAFVAGAAYELHLQFKHKATPCKHEHMILLRSQQVKICADCGEEKEWPLDPGQKPLVGSNRIDRKPGDDYQGV